MSSVCCVLKGWGEWCSEYAIESIARKAYHYVQVQDEHGNVRLDQSGLVQRVTDDEFWDIVSSHDGSQSQQPQTTASDTGDEQLAAEAVKPLATRAAREVSTVDG